MFGLSFLCIEVNSSTTSLHADALIFHRPQLYEDFTQKRATTSFKITRQNYVLIQHRNLTTNCKERGAISKENFVFPKVNKKEGTLSV